MQKVEGLVLREGQLGELEERKSIFSLATFQLVRRDVWPPGKEGGRVRASNTLMRCSCEVRGQLQGVSSPSLMSLEEHLGWNRA